MTKAGLRQIRFHDLRHTFASLLLQQGASLTYVKEQMGHHSSQVTVDTSDLELEVMRKVTVEIVSWL